VPTSRPGTRSNFELTKNSTGTLESIIANDNIQNRSILTIKTGEYFTIKNATAYPIAAAPKVTAENNVLPAGMYKVGVDIPAGEYKITADGSGYVEVSTSSRHQIESIVSNDNFTGEKYVTIKAGQYIKLTNASLKLK
jgi:hypothetical protein